MKYAVVFTTINIPESVLDGLLVNLREFGHLGDTEVIVIGDCKTPKEVRQCCEQHDSLQVVYMDSRDQEKWLMGDLMQVGAIIPWNSDNRRNVGYLMAAARGAEVIISIDDDNWPLLGEDFIGGHSIVGQQARLPSVRSMNGWVNFCRPLCDCASCHPLFPRGFPYSKRLDSTFRMKMGPISETRVMVNEGLWVGDPDVDATTRLNQPQPIDDPFRSRFILAKDMKAPVNSQNTAFHRDVLPCFYFIPMGFRHNGLTVDRYGDIWMGYFAQKVIASVGGSVCFGQPIVRHERNPHDLFLDLAQELGGMMLTEALVEHLEDIELSGKSYGDDYVELGTLLYDEVLKGWTRSLEPPVRQYFKQLKNNMEIWVEACEKVMR